MLCLGRRISAAEVVTGRWVAVIPAKEEIMEKIQKERLTEDERYMKEAIRQARKAEDLGEVPIGCVIVQEGKIIARGYNRRMIDHTTLAHAEILAIKKACRKLKDWRLEGCRIYITLEPCPMCAGAIVQARIPEVVIGCMNPKAGCAGSVTDLLHQEGFNHRCQVETGVLGEACSQMMKDFFKRLREQEKEKKQEKTAPGEDLRKMRYKLAIFDMDGTILDTIQDLADTMNYTLEVSGYPLRTLQEVKSFVGNGIRNLIRRAVPETVRGDEAEIERLYEVFSAHYKEHCADTTKPYEGICALLRQLKEAKIKTAVVSNKADFGVQELCARYFPGLFDVAIGEQPGLAKKPAPDMVGQVLSRLAAAPKEAVYIGDSEVDIATAKNAAMDGVIVSWGFRDPAVLKEQGAMVIVSSVPELQALLLTPAPSTAT